jgi:hypothetical protein
VSAWRLSYMITGRKHPREALGLAMTAAAALERAMRGPSPEQLSAYGALHLAAATAAAACYDRTAAQNGEALDTAAMPARLVGRRTQVNLDLARAYAMYRKDAAAVNSCWPPSGSVPSWSATTRRPGTSSPNCCAASTGPPHRNCARWPIARA